MLLSGSWKWVEMGLLVQHFLLHGFFMSYGRLFGSCFFFFFSHALLHMSTILALEGAHIQANVIML